MTLAARIGDMHACPMVTGVVPHVGGPIAMGCPTVLTVGVPQARVGDMAVCVGPPDAIAIGSFTVLVGGMPAARMGDMCTHGGVIVIGAPTVLIGGGGGGNGGSGGPMGAGMGAGPGQVNDASAVFSTGPAHIAPWKQAIAYKNAHRQATPFCERCQA